MAEMNEAQDTVGGIRALVVDEDTNDTRQIVAFLKTRGFEVLWATDREAAYRSLNEHRIDVMVTELHVNGIDGMKLLRLARRRNPEVCVVMIADGADVELATEAMRQGAYDFQTKPLNLGKLEAVIERSISHQRLVVHTHRLRQELDARFGLRSIIGDSPEMIAVCNRIRQIAPTRSTVLVVGPTGSGKELVAKALHRNSPRKDSPFVTLNCAALSENLIESELFGHVKGAYTGAHQARQGRFEIADGGTLFLDEIAELSSSTQAKLLRALEERQFERVGDSKSVSVDVRLIAATNRALEGLVKEGTFREDLYYRLNVVKIQLPDLRQRREDIPLLVDAFIKEVNRENGKNVTGISRGAMRLLQRYDWPGNVRVLKNIIEGMVVFAPDGAILSMEDMPDNILESLGVAYLSDTTSKLEPGTKRMKIPVGTPLADIERTAIEETLKATGGDKAEAAKTLRIGLRTLYRKLKEYNKKP
jgi:DNA-binding NtrC family response regulator